MLSLPVCFSGEKKHITWEAGLAIILLTESFMRQYQRGNALRLCQTTGCTKGKKNGIIETGANKVGNEEGIDLIAQPFLSTAPIHGAKCPILSPEVT